MNWKSRKLWFSLLALLNINLLQVFEKITEDNFIIVFLAIYSGLIGSNLLSKCLELLKKEK